MLATLALSSILLCVLIFHKGVPSYGTHYAFVGEYFGVLHIQPTNMFLHVLDYDALATILLLLDVRHAQNLTGFPGLGSTDQGQW